MDWCSDLIIRTDYGSSECDHKNITIMQCKAEIEGRLCLLSGKCVSGRESKSWAMVSKKTLMK
jgi:hypothetical protein